MTLLRTIFALFVTLGLTGSFALAGGHGIGVGGGVGGGVNIGVPPVNVPPVNVPPVNVPPVNPPKPNPNANANASAHANVSGSSQLGTNGILKGTLTSLTGTTATVRLQNGTTQTFNVSADTSAELQAMVGKPIAFRTQNGSLVVAGHEGNVPTHATLTSLTGTTAIVRLANGTMQTFNLTASQAAQLSGHVGKQIVFWTNANGSLQLNQQQAHAQNASHTKKPNAAPNRPH